MNANELLAIFRKANNILTISCQRARDIREKANNINLYHKNVNKWIDAHNKKTDLLFMADRIEARGRKVWDEVTWYQGKYINYRNLTDDEIQIHELINLSIE